MPLADSDRGVPALVCRTETWVEGDSGLTVGELSIGFIAGVVPEMYCEVADPERGPELGGITGMFEAVEPPGTKPLEAWSAAVCRDVAPPDTEMSGDVEAVINGALRGVADSGSNPELSGMTGMLEAIEPPDTKLLESRPAVAC